MKRQMAEQFNKSNKVTKQQMGRYEHTWGVFWEACCDAHEYYGQDQLLSSFL